MSRAAVTALDHVAAQSADDAARFVALGVAAAQVSVCGNLKFDLDLPASVHEQAAAVRRDLGGNRPLLIAASTRDGEELLLLDAVRALRRALPRLLLILAPRHLERFDEVAGLCGSAGLRCLRHSARQRCDETVDVYLIDSMGELPRFYAAADVAFVGGSLLPFGGHNVLEPAMLGTPVLVGPHTFNFVEVVRVLAEAGALKVIADGAALETTALAWLRDSNERDRVGGIGREIVQRHRGATARTLTIVQRLLERAR